MDKPRTLQTPGVEFSYRDIGSPEATPVLLLHGFPDAAIGWDPVIDRLNPNKNGLRLLVPSMRGYGDTHVRKDNLLAGQNGALAADVLAFADALSLQRFIILGHDWGARAGFNVSVLAPDRVLGHLALSSPYLMFGGSDLPPQQVQNYWYQWYFQTAGGARALHTNAKALCEHIWHAWSPRWRFSKRELDNTAAFWANPQFAPVVLDSYRYRWGNSLGKPAYAATQATLDAKPTPRISVPTLFGYGTDDHCVMPEASLSDKKNFTGWYDRVAIKGSGHFPHREDPAAVAKLFTRLLKKIR